MSDPSEKTWSNSPTAPQIPYSLYLEEKVGFAGDFFAAISYGITTVLFFQCMAALFDPTNHTKGRGVKWWLVVHTTVMFSLATVGTAMGLNLQSIFRIDNREFPGGGQFSPGPLGYKQLIFTKAISIIPNIVFQLTQWLADGLLLYRCYIIYATNYWVIAFPCLMYLASLATGIACAYGNSRPENSTQETAADANFSISYFTVSFSLNIILTTMIVARLILHRRNVQNAMGGSAGAGRLYGAVIAILVESSAVYAIGFLLFFVPWASQSLVGSAFWPFLFEAQVIAPLLIIQRVASRRALTSEAIISGDPGSIRFKSLAESTSDNGTLANHNPTSPTDAYGEIARGLSVGVEITSTNSHLSRPLED